MRQHVLLCEFDGIDPDAVSAGLASCECTCLAHSDEPIADRFGRHAWRLLEIARARMADGSPETTQVLQVVVPDSGESGLMEALHALVATACAEDGRLIGQLIVLATIPSTADLCELLRREALTGRPRLVRHADGVRSVAAWKPFEAADTPAADHLPWKQGGVYLVTGGLGGLGLAFAQEIARAGVAPRLVLAGRTPPDERAQARLDALRAMGAHIEVRTVDVARPGEVKAVVEDIVARHGGLQGVLHAAGVLRDRRALDKSADEFAAVLRPKVDGLVALDAATAHLRLDFFVAFSSVAGALGNPGQVDYAAANAFMDAFMRRRADMARRGERHGRSLSIGWPLWADAGMGLDERRLAALAARSGMHPMPHEAGMQAFQAALHGAAPHVMVLHGERERLEDWLVSPASADAPPLPSAPTPAPTGTVSSTLEERVQAWLAGIVSATLKLPHQRIRPELPFGGYGIDSVSVLEMTGAMEKVCGSLPKTMFYEHRDIGALTAHLLRTKAEALGAALAPAAALASAAPERDQPTTRPASAAGVARATHAWTRSLPTSPAPAAPVTGSLDIAIIGHSGRYPGARDLTAFWDNLRAGRESVVEVPPQRWDWRSHADEAAEPGRQHAGRWGGFLDGIDEFDAAFFGIADDEAGAMDPQERLFLEQAWAAIEDAGYDWRRIADGAAPEGSAPVGVYVGAMSSDYALFGLDSEAGNARAMPSSSLASIANRVSHLLDLQGPSLTIDSMCSSALTALHLACQDLRHGSVRLAIAGGVSLALHPHRYAVLQAKGMLSAEPRMRSFGPGGHGYVPAEGVGAVLLKRLADAERDGDQILGVIKGSALSHGGRTLAYTVPGLSAQSAAIARALREAQVPARAVSCIEAHGSGTELGDPIEVAALTAAFRRDTRDDGFCWLGSVKGNIGHGEAVAGMAGLAKLLLQMRHGQLAPTLHAETVNPNIDFDETPFRLIRGLQPWVRPEIEGREWPRIAGLSAFGAGGANAHLVVAEHLPAPADGEADDDGGTPALIPLSARTAPALREIARRLLDVVTAADDSPSLRRLAHVLQTGREAMAERLGVLAASREDLARKLRAFLDGETGDPHVLRGRVVDPASPLAALSGDDDLREAVDAWLAKGRLEPVIALWTQGVEIDWRRLHGERAPRRCSLPGYPFARDRHWWSQAVAPARDLTTPEEADRPDTGGFGRVLATTGSAHDKLVAFLAALLANASAQGPARIGGATRLADLALGSIDVVRCTELLQASLGLDARTTDFYQAATVSRLAELVAARRAPDAATLDRAARRLVTETELPSAPADVLPLTDMQQAFVVGRQMPTLGRLVSSTIYVELHSAAPVDAARLRAAWQRLLERHEALRLRLTPDLHQRIADELPAFDVGEIDLSHASADEREAARERLRREMSATTFDLAAGPCFELRVSHAPGASAIHLVLDEVLADGYSAQLLVRELHAAYIDPSAVLPALAYGYRRALAHRQLLREGEAGERADAYWERKLARCPAGVALALAHGAPSETAVHCLAACLEAPAWQALQDGARRLGCFPSSVLLAAFCDALRQHTGQSAFSLTLTHLNRPAVHRDMMAIVGLLIESTVFVQEAGDGDTPFEARLLATQAQFAEDARHAHAGMHHAARARRDGDGPTASTVVFTSLIGAAFEPLPPDAAWTTGPMFATTPQTHLDHQALEIDGELVLRWYVADAVHAAGEVRALLADYVDRLRRLAHDAPAWRLPSAGAEPHVADTRPFALTNQQVAYAFGRDQALREGGKGCVFHAEYDIDNLDVERLTRAWRRVVAHHPMLRTMIATDGTQRLLEPAPEVGIDVLGPAADAHAFAQLCEHTRARMLATIHPLDAYPFFALVACTQAVGTARLLVDIDLLVADGCSLMLVIDQLFELYHQPHAELPPCATSFRAETRLRANQRGTPAHARDAAYWRGKFEALPDGPRCGRVHGSARAPTRQLARAVPTAPLRRAAEALGCELGTLLLAAYGQVVLAWNGGEPFSVVTVHWDRQARKPALDHVVGDFTRLGWVSFGPGGRDPADLVARVRRQLDADARHRTADGLEALRRRQTLSFPMVFTDLVRPADAGPPEHADVRQVFCASQTPQVTLDAIAVPISRSELQLQWDTTLAGVDGVDAQFDAYVETLLRWADEIPTAQPIPALDFDLATDGLHTLLERAAARYASRPALRFDDQALSYSELDARTAACARWLRERGVGTDDVVAVLMERSVEMVVALLGIVRAGAAYLPLDPSFPRPRMEAILADARTRCMLTQSALAPDWLEGHEVLCVDHPQVLGAADGRLAPADVRPHHLAYVIYTSGSSGLPKGCMIEHRAIVNRLAWMQARFPLAPGDVVLQKTPYTFDVSVWEFFWPLIVGATLVVAKPRGHLDGDYLLELIQRERVAVCHFVPSMLRTVLQEPHLYRMAGMRHVMVSGEELTHDLIEEFHDKVPVTLENLYGPTEAAVDVSHWQAEPNPERLSFIGRAIDGITLHVLDDRLTPMPEGETGELYIAGVGVGRGYLNNPLLTDKVFVPDPFSPGQRMYRTGDLASVHGDGNIRYHGRADTQVKLNGLRIELEDIEHHLRAHPDVKDAVVAIRELGREKVLAAFVVPHRGDALPEGLRDFVAERLPRYMVPHTWTVIAAVPVTAHGKRDRKSLPDPASPGAPPTRGAALPHPVDLRLREMLTELIAEARVSTATDRPRADEVD